MLVTVSSPRYQELYPNPLCAARAIAAAAAFQQLGLPDPIRQRDFHSTSVEAIREIGERADAGSYGRSAPDLQSLIDGLVANYGTEFSSPEGSAKGCEAAAKVSQSAQGASQAASGLQETGYAAHRLSRQAQDIEWNADSSSALGSRLSEANQEAVQSEHEVGQAESQTAQARRDMDDAERFAPASRHGERAGLTCREEIEKHERDKRLVLAAAEDYLRKAAARDSAGRVRRAMAQGNIENVEEKLTEVQVREAQHAEV